MATSKVRFFFGTLAKYEALETKDPLALYFVTDEETGKVYLYKGSHLYASDALASAIADGWMSKEDKINLDSLVENAIMNLQPVDGSITISDRNKIGVALSSEAGNILSLKNDGLYVDASGSIDVPEYSIEKQAVADEGFNATYKLKKTVGSESSYVGDSINVAIDAVLSSADFKTVTENGIPYEDAIIGDPYIELGFNDEARTHLYIPMKGLVDQYTAGDGIKIDNNVVSINLGSNANGLHFVDGTLNLSLATKDIAGALSAVDKAFIDSISDVFATKEELQAVVVETIGTPNAEQFTIDENGILTLTSLDADKVFYNGQKLSEVLDDMNNSYIWEELTETVNTDATNAVSVISTVDKGATVKINNGTINESINVDKSISLEGESAGVA